MYAIIVRMYSPVWISEYLAPSVEGVWKQTGHFWITEFGDTVFVDPDSTEWFGFGTYELTGDTLIERLSTWQDTVYYNTEVYVRLK